MLNILNFREWILNEASLTLAQFMKRVDSNLNAFFQKIQKGEAFNVEKGGTPIKLLGLAIKEKKSDPILHLVKNSNQKKWVDTIRKIIEHPDFKNNKGSLFVIVDDGQHTPTLKPLGILSKTTEFGSKGSSMKDLHISDDVWGNLSNLKGLTILKPRKIY